MAALPKKQAYDGPSFGAPAKEVEGRRSDEKALVKDAEKHGLTEERRNRVRERCLAEIPWWYSPYGHVAGTVGVGLVVLALSIVKIRDVHAVDLLVVPLTLLLANYYEWRVHKFVLHKRWWPFTMIYDKHTPMHHMIYVEEDMALRSPKEVRLVAIPAAGVLGIVLATTPLALLVAYVWSRPAGWLFLLTASFALVSYEVLHLCYHAPKDSWIGRRRIIGVLRAHHARHHDPRLMQRYNFNVTVPFFDWVMRTMAPKK